MTDIPEAIQTPDIQRPSRELVEGLSRISSATASGPGVDAARAVPGIENVVVTVKPGERLVPWPEGASYPGFIFARGGNRNRVVDAVRAAHACLTFDIAPELPLQRERRS